jgi:hypothetical protein
VVTFKSDSENYCFNSMLKIVSEKLNRFVVEGFNRESDNNSFIINNSKFDLISK